MGNSPSTSPHDNGHEVRLWGNIQEQIDEIIPPLYTINATSKDIVISDQITATTDLERL